MEPIHITLVGCGNVGNAVATILLNRTDQPIHLNIMEPGAHQHGRILELYHTAALAGIHRISENDARAFAEADVVFHTAGRCMGPNETRLDVAQGNIALTEMIFKPIRFTKTPFLIVLSNPVDVVTYWLHQLTGLPRTHVLGTGAWLDSARFSSNLLRHGVTQAPIPAWVIGEHGDSMVPLFSALDEQHLDADRLDEKFHDILHDTVFAAKAIKQTQDYTSTGVASVAVAMMDSLLHLRPLGGYYPISAMTDAELTRKLELPHPIATSWFYSIDGNLHSGDTIHPNEEEWNYFKRSAAILAEQIAALK